MHRNRIARSFRLVTGNLTGFALMAAFVLSLGCANGEFRPKDPFDRGLSFNESQHRYTVLVRWSEVQKAKAFVAEDARDKFLADMKALKIGRAHV